MKLFSGNASFSTKVKIQNKEKHPLFEDSKHIFFNLNFSRILKILPQLKAVAQGLTIAWKLNSLQCKITATLEKLQLPGYTNTFPLSVCDLACALTCFISPTYLFPFTQDKKTVCHFAKKFLFPVVTTAKGDLWLRQGVNSFKDDL